MFDGTVTVNFGAIDFLVDTIPSAPVVTSDADDVTGNASAADGVVATVFVEVTYYHCGAGSFWNLTETEKVDFNWIGGECKLCTEEIDGKPEVLPCV